jgi:hypothetical protein
MGTGGVTADLQRLERLQRRLRRGRMHVVGSGIIEKHRTFS